MYIFGNQKNGQAVSPAETVAPEAGTPEETAQGGAGCAEAGTVRESLAMVYSPRQYWRDAYTPAEALDHGTLFKELDKPLTGICGEGRGCL